MMSVSLEKMVGFFDDWTHIAGIRLVKRVSTHSAVTLGVVVGGDGGESWYKPPNSR